MTRVLFLSVICFVAVICAEASPEQRLHSLLKEYIQIHSSKVSRNAVTCQNQGVPFADGKTCKCRFYFYGKSCEYDRRVVHFMHLQNPPAESATMPCLAEMAEFLC